MEWFGTATYNIYIYIFIVSIIVVNDTLVVNIHMVNKISIHKFLVFLMMQFVWRQVLSGTVEKLKVPGEMNDCWVVFFFFCN